MSAKLNDLIKLKSGLIKSSTDADIVYISPLAIEADKAGSFSTSSQVANLAADQDIGEPTSLLFIYVMVLLNNGEVSDPSILIY